MAVHLGYLAPHFRQLHSARDLLTEHEQAENDRGVYRSAKSGAVFVAVGVVTRQRTETSLLSTNSAALDTW